MDAKLKRLVNELAFSVVAQNEALFKADAKTANKHALRQFDVYRELRNHGDIGRDAVARLLKHPRMDVRVAAAAFLLSDRYRIDESLAVIEKAAKGKGLIPWEASFVLKYWKEGTWDLDLDEKVASVKIRRLSSKMTLKELVEVFAQATAAQTDCRSRGYVHAVRKYGKKRKAAFDRIRAQGDAGRDALAALFFHPRLDVRVAAADSLLRHRTAAAKGVLKKISKGEGIAAYDAFKALKQWEEGTWALDPE